MSEVGIAGTAKLDLSTLDVAVDTEEFLPWQEAAAVCEVPEEWLRKAMWRTHTVSYRSTGKGGKTFVQPAEVLRARNAPRKSRTLPAGAEFIFVPAKHGVNAVSDV